MVCFDRKKIGGILIFLCLAMSIGLIKKYGIENRGAPDHEAEENLSEKEGYKKGYNLPVSEKDKREAESECSEVMEIVRKIYADSDKGNSINVTVPKSIVKQMYDAIAAGGFTVSDSGNTLGMENCKKMEQFITNISNGQKSEVVIYRVLTSGGIARQKFIYDGMNLYSLYTNAVWAENRPDLIMSTSYTRINDWNYTEEGWFHFVYCVPEYPEVTEEVNGNMLIRVKPFNTRYQELTEKYLAPVSYQGNNMLCSNWDQGHMENLDYTGLFESFYFMKYGERFPFEQYPDEIPGELFETVMTGYLPVSIRQLKEYASYNKQNTAYKWENLGCGNFTPNVFSTSYPEVTDLVNNSDGTLTMTVNAVCEAAGDVKALTHKLTVRLSDDGSIEYLSNQILGDGLNNIPVYQFRIPEV